MSEEVSQEDSFHVAMLGIYNEGKNQTGYNATRFLQMVRDKGGLHTAKELLAGDPLAVSAGFRNLAFKGRLDLSVEALVQKDEWKNLFTTQELNVAAQRLK